MGAVVRRHRRAGRGGGAGACRTRRPASPRRASARARERPGYLPQPRHRAGVYVALEALRRLDNANVAVVAGAQEELGHHGARAAAHRLRPDVAIAIDVTYATDVPAGDANEAGDHRLGGGPAIFRGPAINPRIFELLVEAAQAEGIEHTIETGMKTFTDADDTFASREGIPTGLISIPLRNMHSPIEIADLADLDACIRLLVAFAGLLLPGASYAR